MPSSSSVEVEVGVGFGLRLGWWWLGFIRNQYQMRKVREAYIYIIVY